MTVFVATRTGLSSPYRVYGPCRIDKILRNAGEPGKRRRLFKLKGAHRSGQNISRWKMFAEEDLHLTKQAAEAYAAMLALLEPMVHQ